jgi:hypothetical protein
MNFRDTRNTVPGPGRGKAVAALAALGLALAVAGPAFAEPAKPPAKKGCSIQFQGPGAGQSIEYPDGYKYVVNATDGKTHTYTCNDGAWKETVSLTGGSAAGRNAAIVRTAGVLQTVPRR